MHRFAFAPLLLMLVSCDSATGPGGLQVDLAVAPAAIRPNETATIMLTVWNPTGATLVVSGSGSCTFGFAVEGVDERSACTSNLQTWTFAPGERRSFAFDWNGVPRRSWSALDGPPDRLPPGEYRLRGVLDAQQGRGHSEPVVLQLLDYDPGF